MLYIPKPVSRVCLDCGKITQQHELVKHRGYTDGVESRCRQCHAQKSKEYRNAHLLERRETTRRSMQRYRKQFPEKNKENKRKYYVQHRNEVLEHCRDYAERNRNQIRVRRRLLRQRNKEKNAARLKQWSLAHPEIKRAARKRRQMQKRNLPATFTGEEWLEALDYFHGVCVYCGKGPSLFDRYGTLQQDHFVPVSKGGGYVRDNMLPACQSCNYSKKDRDPVEWLVEHFGKRKANGILKRIQEYFEHLSSH